MSLPTLIKTWQVSRNNTVPALGSTMATSRRTWRTIKNVMIGFASNAWTVRGSSNAVAFGMDSVDRWAADGDLVWGAGNHSWIVIRQAGMGTNFELCIDLNNGFERWGSLVISYTGFSGGALDARPTAADEFVWVNNTDFHPELDQQRQIHGWQSTDGECTRLCMWMNNSCPIFWIFEKPRQPRTGWANPNVHMMRHSSSGAGSFFMNHADLRLAYTQGPARGKIGATTALLSFTGEQAQDGWLATVAPTSTMQNEIDGAWDFYPIGFATNSGLVRGRHGSLHDIWWAPSALVNGDTAPNDAGDRQFVKMGGLWLPWHPGGATVPLFV